MERNLSGTFVFLAKEELDAFKLSQQQILEAIKELKENKQNTIVADYISAAEFQKAVGIKRTKFYELVNASKIKTLKKGRWVYVLASEVKRYFIDPTIR